MLRGTTTDTDDANAEVLGDEHRSAKGGGHCGVWRERLAGVPGRWWEDGVRDTETTNRWRCKRVSDLGAFPLEQLQS